MAITAVTGLPGHGKTLYTLARFKPEAEKEGRPVFHNSIPGLDILGWQPWKVEEWEQLPAGSIFIVDEAQFAFPVTGRGQTPDWVQKLATHRHRGVDLVVITQDPMLLDSFVRRLVDRHFHVVRKFGTQWATIHEFPNGMRENVRSNRKDSIRHDWKYQKEVFTWYKSAELHTVKRRIPMKVWLMFACFPAALLMGGVAYWKLKPSTVMQSPAQASSSTSSSTQPGGQGGEKSKAGMTVEEYALAYRARVPGLAHTAPIYDKVTDPQQAPYPAACVQMRGECRCYTQQATRLDVQADVCAQIVAGGFFVAWDKPVAHAIPLAASAAVPEPQQYAQAMSLGGTPGAPRFTSPAPPAVVDDGPPQPRARKPQPG